MSLTMQSSLSLMLQLLASIVHLAALTTPCWVQLGVFAPSFPLPSQAGGSGDGEGGGGNGTGDSAAAVAPVVAGVGGSKKFVRIRLGLWDWCGQFKDLDPDCQQPGFLGGVQTLELVSLLTLTLSFLLLACSPFVSSELAKRRRFTLASLLLSLASGAVILAALVTYGTLSQREITNVMLQIGESTELSFLGWSFGADVITCVMLAISALCLVVDLRISAKAANTQSQLVV